MTSAFTVLSKCISDKLADGTFLVNTDARYLLEQMTGGVFYKGHIHVNNQTIDVDAALASGIEANITTVLDALPLLNEEKQRQVILHIKQVMDMSLQ